MFKDFLLLISFMSRIPVKSHPEPQAEDWARALRFLPLWGLILGILIAATAHVVAIINAPVAAACSVAAAAFLTGGLHLDGLMDTADGLAAGTDRERAFRFMSDARVGAMGIISLVIVLILKYALYLLLIERWQIWWAIPAAVVFSRFAVTLVVYAFPNAKKFGLAASFHQHFHKKYFIVACLILLIIFLVFSNWFFILAAVFGACVVFTIAHSWTGRLGGLTGDMYGAIAEWSEIFFLLLYFTAVALAYNLGPILF
ncbi:MAG: adenosylcobinamide-GDP ribazoletransferase [Bacillota bacterium]|jgi:adenosylcobinamide-GDP ribazoletransferase